MPKKGDRFWRLISGGRTSKELIKVRAVKVLDVLKGIDTALKKVITAVDDPNVAGFKETLKLIAERYNAVVKKANATAKAVVLGTLGTELKAIKIDARKLNDSVWEYIDRDERAPFSVDAISSLLGSGDLSEKTIEKLKKRPVSVVMDDGTRANLFLSDIHGFEEMSSEKIEEVIKACAEKVKDGKAKLDAILDPGQELPDVSKDAIADVMWYLKSQAQLEGGSFDRGAFTVNGDNADRLFEWFKKLGGDCYTRLSTHLGSHRSGGDDGSPRGIDFEKSLLGDDGGVRGPSLPGQMGTILIQKPVDGQIYLKIEPDGLQNVSLAEKASHGVGGVLSKIGGTPPGYDPDLSENAPRESQIPAAIKALFKAFKTAAGESDIADLPALKEAKSIFEMYEDAKSIKNHTDKMTEKTDKSKALNEQANTLITLIDTGFPKVKDGVKVYGSEVALVL